MRTRGFTLIELLVVIAIIGILSAVVITSLNSSRAKARDAQRKAELTEIQKALELYANDYGHYPCENASLCSGQSKNANGKIGEGSGLDTLLAPYMQAIPHDPLGPGNAAYYYYYDGQQNCTKDGAFRTIAVIFAYSLETPSSGNASDFCDTWGGEGGAGNANGWYVVIGSSPT